jgi:pyruvate,water dikinase
MNYICTEDDIFYLSYQEIIEFHDKRLSPEAIKQSIRTRKDEMQRLSGIRLPSVIIGDNLPPKITTTNISCIMRGIPAAKGYCTGKITLIKNTEDFHKVTRDNILVIPHSDISWTPIFVNAKGIISESGGMLSHCSIIAREYGIPAVVSVPNALKLNDNTIVALDGDKGEILILDE